MLDKKGQDTGRDCGHCGAPILLQTDTTDEAEWSYYECSDCGCRWTLSDELFHRGHFSSCQTQERAIDPQPSPLAKVPPIGWVLILFLIGLALPPTRIAFVLLLRVALPMLRFIALPVLLGLLAWGIYVYGRRRAWW